MLSIIQDFQKVGKIDPTLPHPQISNVTIDRVNQIFRVYLNHYEGGTFLLHFSPPNQNWDLSELDLSLSPSLSKRLVNNCSFDECENIDIESGMLRDKTMWVDSKIAQPMMLDAGADADYDALDGDLFHWCGCRCWYNWKSLNLHLWNKETHSLNNFEKIIFAGIKFKYGCRWRVYSTPIDEDHAPWLMQMQQDAPTDWEGVCLSVRLAEGVNKGWVVAINTGVWVFLLFRRHLPGRWPDS